MAWQQLYVTFADASHTVAITVGLQTWADTTDIADPRPQRAAKCSFEIDGGLQLSLGGDWFVVYRM